MKDSERSIIQSIRCDVAPVAKRCRDNYWLVMWVEHDRRIWLSDDVNGSVKFGSRRSGEYHRHLPHYAMVNWEWA